MKMVFRLFIVLCAALFGQQAMAQGCGGLFKINQVCAYGPSGVPLARVLTAADVAGAVGGTNSVDLATTGNITLSGEQTIDGTMTSTSRVLVKNQSTASQNGPYITSSGGWTRATDGAVTGQLVRGSHFYVSGGATNINNTFVVTTPGTITIGTTAIAFSSAIGGSTIVSSDTTASTGLGIGAVKIAGGLSVSGDMWIGASNRYLNIQYNSNGSGLRFYKSDGTTFAGAIGLNSFGSASAGNDLQIRSDTGDIVFGNSGVEKLRINSSLVSVSPATAFAGNVGIGTGGIAQANTQLWIGGGSPTVGDPTTARQLKIGVDSNSAYSFNIGYYKPGTGLAYAGVLQALDSNNPSPLLLNPLGGNIGIGTATPAFGLDVQVLTQLKPPYPSDTSLGSIQINTTGPSPDWATYTGLQSTMRMSVNNCPVGTQFGSNYVPIYEGIVSCLSVPQSEGNNTAQTFPGNAIAGYGVSNVDDTLSVHIGHGAAGVFGGGFAGANNTSNWGLVALVSNMAGQNLIGSAHVGYTNVTSYGIEIDMNPIKGPGGAAVNAAMRAIYFNIGGDVGVVNTNDYVAMDVDATNGTPFDYGLRTHDGRLSSRRNYSAISLGTTGTGNNVASQNVSFTSRDSGGTNHFSTVNADATGNLILNPTAGGLVSLQDGNGNAPLVAGTNNVKITGNIQIQNAGIIYPITDSTTAIKFAKANASTIIMTLDTSNARLGINKTPGAFDLDVNGAVNIGSGLSLTGNATLQSAANTLVLKRGSNGSVGTFVCNGSTPVTISNTNIAITDTIIISLNTVGGTVGASPPTIKTITAASGFTAACLASDTSTYNYSIIKNAA